ncbi:conserved hypothetical protein [Anaeromyxobacter dehalogenans 2CP-1]|uniref:Uncharacterized protein n=1 Tax=Anaeromyxobacter dehalogenans (strain ATCC BAA-258 / DSM 21875 / 2CP-1) TaxID=455488 RepID=B8JDP7_ANAD2|nr:conserved hypothetical protein [Anaeromyxobacter dehalogenans 2CP-1]
MRGDRPSSGLRPAGSGRASPRARGSTRSVERRGLLRAGFPACAGIDPAHVPHHHREGGLPRVRGDRPEGASRDLGRQRASPRARGSTRAHHRGGRPRAGFPACAGIDPVEATVAAVTSRLPRVRGDRPRAEPGSFPDHWASPRARGSTRGEPAHRDDAHGFPACAGIDPPRSQGPGRRCRLPRVRGDRPGSHIRKALSDAASPRARGSTPVEQVAEVGGRGFPACAGIDPASTTPGRRRRRLPRVRGDRPVVDGRDRERIPASPRARGSTRPGRVLRAEVGGFPACAGIDPAARGRPSRGGGLPRVRGDRPWRR